MPIKWKIGNGLIILLIVLPALILFISGGLNNWSNFGIIANNVGRILGLIGIAMVAMNIILSAKYGFLENIFGGLNRIYVSHHREGAIALIFLLFHPVFLSLRYLAINVKSALLFFWPGFGQLNLMAGLLALVSMIVLLIMTLYWRPKYNYWKISHKFLDVAFIFMFLHIYFVSSDVATNLILRTYLFTFSILAIASIIYRTVLPKMLVKKHEFEISGVNQLNSQVTELVFRPIGKPFSYLPGQFIYLQLSGRPSREEHPFSISSSPDSEELKVTIKNSGDFTSRLNEIKTGDRALIEGPFGRFSFGLFKNINQIWIAGGIGITPFLSMARSLNDRDCKIDLYYTVKNSDEAVFADELGAIANRNPNLKFFMWLSDSQGRLDAKKIVEKSGEILDKEVFICGPVAMMKAISEQFIGGGVNKQKIHSEEFQL